MKSFLLLSLSLSLLSTQAFALPAADQPAIGEIRSAPSTQVFLTEGGADRLLERAAQLAKGGSDRLLERDTAVAEGGADRLLERAEAVAEGGSERVRKAGHLG